MKLRPLFAAFLVSLPGAALAAVPAEGVDQVVRQGFFTETDMGVFFTEGGKTGNGGFSNAQAYLQLGIGYDIGKSVSLGASFGLGASAANCFAPLSSTYGCGVNNQAADNFTISFFQASLAYRFFLMPRFSIAPKLTLGYATLNPSPLDDTGATIGGLAAGGGFGLEYATHMDHFTVGIDLVETVVMVSPVIPSTAIFPRVKYTF